MTLVTQDGNPSSSSEPNPTLQGHKLLVLLPRELPLPDGDRTALTERLCASFPGLAVAVRGGAGSWGDRWTSDMFPAEEWRDVTVLLTGAALPPSRDVAPRLAYVQLMSAGANHVLADPLFKETDVAFCTANGVHGPQISEWVIATFLMSNHHLPHYLEKQRNGKWERNPVLVQDAVNQRVGILGYGAIGRQVARVAKAMGMDVHAYTLHPRDTPSSRRDQGWSPPGLGDPEGALPSRWFSGTSTAELHAFLLSGLDLLVVALPLTDKTRGLLGRAEFEALASGAGARRGGATGAFLSNVGRGPIVRTDDLVEALEAGTVRGAALDVTDPEPLPEGHPLWGAKNVIITPHVSGASTAYVARVLSILEFNLHRLADGKPLFNTVSRREGY